ncbi:MAG TPA: glutamate-1-semialdehyde 2,1-aminomutase, partial [Polyangia bacterium]|nr:glutamate-1-semialdehyde 2,1-aminomutase [Polyangia bacterium]
MTAVLYALGAVALTASLPRLRNRLALSRAKHRSLRGHSRISRLVAALVPHYEYDEARFFRSDDAPVAIAERRRAGFMRLAALYQARFAETVKMTREVEGGLSDLQFTSHYRVPFQYSRFVRQHMS